MDERPLSGAIARYEGILREHIVRHAGTTLKQPVHYLRHPFIDPGSVYEGNLWDWDSFWATYALFNLVEGGDDERRELYLQHARGNVFNFLDYQMSDGYIPMMVATVDSHGNDRLPEPYLNHVRRQGRKLNMHKPFLCQQINMISQFAGDYYWVGGSYQNLESYFACYDRDYYQHNCGLYVWADDIMIGMDNDPATFGRPRYSTANIFLNAFMVAEIRAMASISKRLGKEARAAYYMQKSDRLAEAIQAECWDPRDRFYYSVDVDVKTRRFDWFHQGLGVFWKTLPIKIRTWSGFIPLLVGIAGEREAAYLAEQHAVDPCTFSSPYGITSLAQDEKMFNLSATINPSNWLGPIWVVANYVVFRGLMNYGYREPAEQICANIVSLLGSDLEESGTLHEFYNPKTGKPIMNGGFLNWNLLAVNMIDELKGKVPVVEWRRR